MKTPIEAAETWFDENNKTATIRGGFLAGVSWARENPESPSRAERLERALAECLWVCAEAYQIVGGQTETAADPADTLDLLAGIQAKHCLLVSDVVFDEVSSLDPYDLVKEGK